MKSTEQKINNVIGQLKGISRMIESGEDCVAVITQFRAAIAALRKIMAGHIETEASACLEGKRIGRNKDKLFRIIKELERW